jgi:hypothetical protein
MSTYEGEHTKSPQANWKVMIKRTWEFLLVLSSTFHAGELSPASAGQESPIFSVFSWLGYLISICSSGFSVVKEGQSTGSST